MKKIFLILSIIFVGQVNGQVCFSPADSFAVGTGVHPVSITSNDFNGDGIKDLATANLDSSNVSILLGTGTGSFGSAINFPVVASFSHPNSITSADFNGDGKADLAVSTWGLDVVSILLGTGTGSFGTATVFNVGNH